ncbi:alpha/beta fold hydrolase [Algiphilus sp.]|uniref:alpha/beta fold hydrolase n=1 Tax=Algiphilus sp. TaxID=1872431 RepID=UPI003BAC2DDB
MKTMVTGVLVLALVALAAMAGWSQWGKWRVEQRFPPVGDFLSVDGLRLHYRLMGEGSGTPLVLLHGASSNLRDFSRLQPLLAQGRPVLAIDRPGYGYSQRPEQWPTPARIAELALSAAEALGLERPVLVGHSWAGSVVMAALVHHGERMAGGVLLAGAAGHWAGSVDWTYQVGGASLIGPLFAHTVVYPAGQAMLPAVVERVLAPNPVPEDYVERIGAPLALRPSNFLHNVEDMNRLSEYLQSLSPQYAQIDQPLLLIHGTADELVPFWNHGERLLPVVPQAQTVMLEGVGHAPHHAAPEAVAEAIDRFALQQIAEAQR